MNCWDLFTNKWVFIGLAVLFTCVIIGIIVYFKLKRKQAVADVVTESFTGTDVYSDQFKFAESYINSVLGV